MADISTELSAIRTAVYGEQVRSSIINALEKMNTRLSTLELQGRASVYIFKGSVPDTSQLPNARNVIGDLYYVTDVALNYAWNGSTWTTVGGATAINPTITDDISALEAQVSNIKKTHQEYFGANTIGTVREVALESGRMYLVFIGKVNNTSELSGCYLACPHTANSNIVALSAVPSSTATISIESTTLTITTAANYVMLSVIMVY